MPNALSASHEALITLAFIDLSPYPGTILKAIFDLDLDTVPAAGKRVTLAMASLTSFEDLAHELQVMVCSMMTPQTFAAFKMTSKTMTKRFEKFKFPAQAQLYNEEVREVIKLLDSSYTALGQAIVLHNLSFGAELPTNLLTFCREIVTEHGYPPSLAFQVLNRAQPDIFRLAWSRLDIITDSEIPDGLKCTQCYLNAEPGFAPGYRGILTGWENEKTATLCEKCGDVSIYLNDCHMDEEPEWCWERTLTRTCKTCFADVKDRFDHIRAWKMLHAGVRTLQAAMGQISDSSGACTTPPTMPGLSAMQIQWLEQNANTTDN
ncbi:hypothetical protein AYL99_11745 [Fonsecaea erecta]|uniref:Uncharacterized protein n=1 Tax=Fonsecaea erecta TaxID=1367422 RepID=A0A178Z359_9EURO|nr:hypothetical protein AYL99_11745 [Fonsecaea erecta]OAP54210.1 hypothetical protein AYL99_11745 [Fonsecaea erecta]